ncbi:recQ-mediated genome instability protein 1-like [Chrysoperla carnea]|uniref:recQ-mediated genome instability protein 1-like n=1 Tax=Chrysoperla carnea TaxID=189513 RepID=UPI001D09545F|nr:recQ-mediated genome instability protein 1-like [Chrysoperla carnea]
MNEFEKVKSYFSTRYIHASDEWIKSCIIWYKENYNTDTVTNNGIQIIYEQWLSADLRDIEVGCLPENLKSYKKVTLPGKYALQMHYVIDSSKPAYTQLQVIRNVNTTNEQVTAETQPSFIATPKSNRVLNMLLCDGIQEVKGMEYRIIKKIHTDLTPGIKLLIIGPVDCRNGVLFLKENNVQILGGEIEELLHKNAYENILCRMIGLPENPNPKINETVNTTIQNVNVASENIQIDGFDDDDFMMADIPIEEFEQNFENPPRNTAQTNTRNQQNNQNQTRNIAQNNARREYEHNIENQSRNSAQIYSRKEYENEPTTTAQNNAQDEYEHSITHSSTIAQIDARIDEEFENIDFDFDDNHIDDNIFTTTTNEKVLNTQNNENQNKITPKIVSKKPFVYIKQLVGNTHLPKQKYTVKARIKTLVDKLRFTNKQWMLKCEIVDATSSIIVDFSNRVIEELVGYTAEQMPAIRREIATSSFHKEQLLQALENAKTKLLSLDCLMDIEFSETRAVPLVTRFKEFYYSDLSNLEKRISYALS